MKIHEQEGEMFPFYYAGHMWKEEDCDPMFLCFYNSVESIHLDGGVYAYEGMRIFPDGKIEH